MDARRGEAHCEEAQDDRSVQVRHADRYLQVAAHNHAHVKRTYTRVHRTVQPNLATNTLSVCLCSLDWRVAEDSKLIQPIGKRKPGVDKRKKRSYFAVEQQTKLFSQARYRNRKLITPQDQPTVDQV